MDPRLKKFVQGKFSTELSADSTVLSTMVETLAKNIDQYITLLNSSGLASVGAVSISSPHNPSYSPMNRRLQLANRILSVALALASVVMEVTKAETPNLEGV